MAKINFLLFCLSFCQGCLAITNYYMNKFCYGGSSIDVNTYDQIRLKLTAGTSYGANMRCQLRLTTTWDSQLMVYFKSMDISYSSGCQTDYLQLYDGSTRSFPLIPGGKQCGYAAPSGVYKTSGSDLTLYFQSGSIVEYDTGFDIIVTSFHTGSCYSWEHDCDNGRCIDDSLTCNGYNPCGDYSDCDFVLTVGGIAGIVIGGIVFTVVVIAVVLICRRRRVLYVQQGAPVATVTTATSSYGYNQPVPNQYGSQEYPKY